MQSATLVHGVPFRKKPRNGQRRVFDEAVKKEIKKLNVEQPTGYGKTLTALGAYAIRKKHHGVTRLLYITPTDAQHEQFVNDGPSSIVDAGISGPNEVCDIRFFGVNAIKRSNNNTNQVFATTIQSLNTPSGLNILKDLLQKGVWMAAVDELHHYALNKPWGRVVQMLNDLGVDFLLAMSATPYRPKEDGVSGAPDITIGYRDAVREGAVKKLIGHSYIYKLDATSNGELLSYTTSELIAEAGSDNPEAIEKLCIERQMRWSPKYVSPLVSIPIERMLRNRLEHGVPLQAIIGALCVSHAELVCEQIRAMFPELKVDWVGTGPNGRDIAVNRAILKAFCPPKDSFSGIRAKPKLDALVHVGMAGEGLDTSLVSEVIHANSANVNNTNNQENGRSARVIYLPDGRVVDVIGNINFDSSSGYAESGYIGAKIMDAMNFNPPSSENNNDDLAEEVECASRLKTIPEDPTIQICDMSLLRVDSGSPEVQMFIEALKASNVTGINYSILKSDDSEMSKVVDLYQKMRAREAEKMDSRAVVAQLSEKVEEALSAVAGRVVSLMAGSNRRVEKSNKGDIMKRINGRKKMILGEKTMDEEVLRQHYAFLHKLDETLATGRIPSWLL